MPEVQNLMYPPLEHMGNQKNIRKSARKKKTVTFLEPNIAAEDVPEDVLPPTNGTKPSSWVPVI